MRKLAITAMLCALIAGCSLDDLVLSESEQQDLADNLAAAIEAFQALGEFAISVALGETELTDSIYVEPSELNGWTGTLDYAGNEFPGGNGEISMSFRVLVDGLPVDPYNTDFSQALNVAIDMQVTFGGVSAKGAPLALNADFTLDISAQEGVAASVSTNGAFNITHNAYFIALTAADFQLDFDEVEQVATNVSGRVAGAIDIPNYAFNADVSIDGMGDAVDFMIKVSGTTITDSIPLDELNGIGG